MAEVQCLKKEAKAIIVSGDDGCKKQRKIKVDAPDGALAWTVAIACCVINFIMAGLGRMSGILYVAFIEIYRVGRQEASTPFSVRSSTRNLLGPVVGILGQKYGVRTITMIGGVTATLSAASCFFAPDVTWITVLWGVLNGVGSSLTVILPQVVIGQYFDKHRTTASGMAFSGGCVGSFVFPALLEYLLANYGIGGTFLILAGIIMHTIPAAMILRKPPWMKRPRTESKVGNESTVVENAIEKPLLSDTKAEGNEVNVAICEDYCRVDSVKKPVKCVNISFLRQNCDLVLKMLTISTSGDLTISIEVNQNDLVPAVEFCVWSELEEIFQDLNYFSKKPRYYKNLSLAEDKFSNSFHNERPKKENVCIAGCGGLHKSNSSPDVSRVTNEISRSYILHKLKVLYEMRPPQILALFPEENRQKVTKVSKELRRLHSAVTKLPNSEELLRSGSVYAEVPLPQPAEVESEHSNSFSHHIKTAFRLHLNPLFLIICLCRVIHFITFIPVMTTVVDFVMDKGVNEDQGKYAIASLATGDLLGRLALGWITDKGFLSLPKYMMVIMILQGASTASLPLMQTQWAIFFMLGVFGMLQGSLFVRHPVLVANYMGAHEQSIAMGCINFFSGFLGFGLPAYIGYFRDTIGSYDYIFYINGFLGALVGSLWALEPYLRRRFLGERTSDDEVEEPV